MTPFLRSRQIPNNHSDPWCCFCCFLAPHEIFGPTELVCTIFRLMCNISRRPHTLAHPYETSELQFWGWWRSRDHTEDPPLSCLLSLAFSLRVHCISCMNMPETLYAGLITSINLRNLLAQRWPLGQGWPKSFLRFIELIPSQGWPESTAWRPFTYFLQKVSFSSVFLLLWWESLIWHWVLYPWRDILKLNHQP